MEHHASCEQICPPSCLAACPLHASPGTYFLSDVLQRFAREAVQGTCNTGRYRCRYHVWGEGPPLVFLHGLADSSQSFVMPMAILSRWFRCIAYDRPTGADDGANLKHYTHIDLVEDLLGLLDHLQIRQSYLFASSYGSTIALSALHTRPERLPRAILQGPLVYKPLTRIERFLAWLLSRCPGSMRSLPLRVRLLQKLHHLHFAEESPEVWQHFLDYTGDIPIRAVARHARLLHGVDLRQTLPAIRQPVLLLCGDCDPHVSLESTEAMMTALPNAGRAILRNCGHLPCWTHPQALAEIVRGFLTPPSQRMECSLHPAEGLPACARQ